MATILILEDEKPVREMLIRILQTQGYEVLAFEDVQPALKEVNFNEIGLVITDFMMPTRGDIAVQKMRGKGYVGPVVMISGYLSLENLRPLTAIGVRKILWKPFLLTELFTAIEEALEDPFEEKRICA